MSDTSLSYLAFLISFAALIISGLSAIYTRRQAVIMKRQQQEEEQRKYLQIDLAKVVRSDETNNDYNTSFAYPEYFVLKFVINNPSDEPRLLEDVILEFVLRETKFFLYLLDQYREWINKRRSRSTQVELISDRFPYKNNFSDKIKVCIVDVERGSSINLSQTAKIDARNKLWIEILIKTDDDWRKSLRHEEKVPHYLIVNFIFAEQTEQIFININSLFNRTFYSGIDEAEREKISKFLMEGKVFF